MIVDFYDTFKKEIKLMYQINHPNVVRVFTYYLYEDYYTGYILMEYIEGDSIDKWFEDYWLQLTSSNDIFRQLIDQQISYNPMLISFSFEFLYASFIASSLSGSTITSVVLLKPARISVIICCG